MCIYLIIYFAIGYVTKYIFNLIALQNIRNRDQGLTVTQSNTDYVQCGEKLKKKKQRNYIRPSLRKSNNTCRKSQWIIVKIIFHSFPTDNQRYQNKETHILLFKMSANGNILYIYFKNEVVLNETFWRVHKIGIEKHWNKELKSSSIG